MSKKRDHAGRQALEQAVGWGFRFLFVGIAILIVAWLASGFQSVEPGSRAVVQRFGATARIVDSGLVWAWPRPIEHIRIVPGPERQLTQEVRSLARPDKGDLDTEYPNALHLRTNPYVLSGDGGVVQLTGTVVYQVTDPTTYLLAEAQLPQALERLFSASAIHAIASRGLEGVVVIASEGDDGNAANAREALRGDVRSDMQRRLLSLNLGIAITRIDLTSTLPPSAEPEFQKVFAAEANAARMVANARTSAEQYRQQGERERSELIQLAEANAQELISKAKSDTASILALTAERSPEQRRLLLTRLYRERMENIIRRAGLTNLVDGREPIRLLLPGGSELK